MVVEHRDMMGCELTVGSLASHPASPLPYFTGIVSFLNSSLQLIHLQRQNNVNSHPIGLSHFVKSTE